MRAIVLVAVIAVALWWFNRPHLPNESSTQVVAEAPTQTTIPVTATVATTSTLVSPPQPNSISQSTPIQKDRTTKSVEQESSKPTLLSITPSLAQLSEETEKNPHGTAPSFLDFSTQVQERAYGAKTLMEANQVFAELRDCVQNPKDQRAHTVHAVCLMNARALSKRFPELLNQYDDLIRRTNPRVVKLIEDIP